MNRQRGYYEPGITGEFLEFPVSAIPINVMYNGLHWHDHTEVIYCRKGRTKVRIEGEENILMPGDFMVINGGESHEIYDGREEELQLIGFLEARVLGEMENRKICCKSIQGKEQIDDRDAVLVRTALEQMVRLSQAAMKRLESNPLIPAITGFTEEQRCCYQMYMYQLLMVLMKHKVQCLQPREKEKDKIKLCVDYVNGHIGEKLDAEVLANELHVSEPTIYRLFAEQIGIPLGKYITSVRVSAVCRCLEETDDKITNIAMNCGFTGISNFYRVFHDYMGISPKEYRKKHPISNRVRSIYQPQIMQLNRYQDYRELKL